MSDQEGISSYSIKLIQYQADKLLEKKNSMRGLLIDPITNSLNLYYKNCMGREL